MKPHAHHQRAVLLVGAVVLVSTACSHDPSKSWPIPAPPENAELDARMRARIQADVSEVRADPAVPERWLALGMTYEANLLYALAIECYARALELAPSAKAWHRLATAEVAAGNAGAAVCAMRRSIELEPGYAPSHCHLESQLFDLGEFDEALRAFAEVTRLDPENLGGAIGSARVYLQRGEPGKAIEVLERVSRSGDRTVQRLLHTAYLQAGRAEDAARIDVSPRGQAQHYGKDPWQRECLTHWERPVMKQAHELLQAGDPRVIALLEEFIAEAPDDPQASAYLAQAYLKVSRSDDALRVTREALARVPDNLNVLQALASIQDTLGQLDQELATLTRMVEIDPNDESTWRWKGRIEATSGRREAALESLRRVVALDQREPEVLVEIGGLELGLGRPQEAILSYEQARRAGAQGADVVLGLARAYAKAGRVSDALELVSTTHGLGRRGEVLLEELRAAAGVR